MFKAFKPSGMEKIARSMGYNGKMEGFNKYLSKNPSHKQQMQSYTDRAVNMARGGLVFNGGGDVIGGGGGGGGYGVGGGYGGPSVGTSGGAGGYGGDSVSAAELALQKKEQEARDRAAKATADAAAAADAQAAADKAAADKAAADKAAADKAAADKAAAGTTGTGTTGTGTTGTGTTGTGTTGTDATAGTSGGPVYDANGLLIGNAGYYGPKFGEPGGGTAPTPPVYKTDTGTTPTGTGTTGQEPVPTLTIQPLPDGSAPTIGDVTAQRMQNPGLPIGAATVAAATGYDATQDIVGDVGQVAGSVAAPITGATTSYAQAPIQTDANLAEVGQAAPAVDAVLTGLEAAQGAVSEDSKVVAAQQEGTSVSSLNAAQGDAILMDNPVQRQIQAGELITGVADAQKAAQYTEQVQAATATPTQKATVKGQLTDLMSDFDDGQTPAWAAGAMRAATSAMVARGLGASSLAGQAIIQATMESAIPIAQADASTQAQFESQNLTNRQQRAMLAAEQRAKFMGQEFDQAFQSRVANASRIADVANMNFTAEQQVALENSRTANTMNLNNLSNRQGMVMAEAAAVSQMDSANLSNRQQAAVTNSQNFMQIDMANLSNSQQTELFKGQARTQSILTDQAAANAASQFNASSQNQVDQFFSNLANNVSQFNTAQANGQAQFNAGQTNSMEQFNSEINNQRDQFNAQNQLVISQSNATWRRQIATADTAAINRANEVNAQNVLAISNQAYASLWQQYGDTMEWAWTSAENAQDRISAMAIADLDAASRYEVQKEVSSSAAGTAIGSLISMLGTEYIKAKLT